MSTASLITRTRMLLQDTGRPVAANVMVDGQSTVFDLPVESISSINEPIVYFNNQLISGQATPSYFFDYKHGVISFYAALEPAGATLGVQMIAYDYFDDDEITQAVTDGFNMHVADLDPLPAIDPGPGQTGLPAVEEYPVSMLAAVEALWFRLTDASQEIDIHTPEGVTIPRAERFRQLLNQTNALQEEYKTVCGALGVGLWRIQELWQRRVSYTTNRLVPLFREQEYNAPYTGFEPTTGIPGTVVTIYGQYFTDTTSVTFGGVQATWIQVVSDTEVQAEVPDGGLTGQIGVTTPYGVVLTTAQFVVGQPAPFVLYGPQQVKLPIPPGT